ncbi:MAG TPA: hypothetical protein VJU77_06035 [Chthoniobacterales bacterium]|nr:hypothetical protein [Chthoniobacterales bacterium]
MSKILWEIWAHIKDALSPIFIKRTRGGRIVFAFLAIFYLSDKFDSVASIFAKVSKMGPVWKFVVDVMQSPVLQIILFLAGAIWIGYAALRAHPDNFPVLTEERRKELMAANREALSDPVATPSILDAPGPWQSAIGHSASSHSRLKKIDDCAREAAKLLRDDGTGAKELWSFNAICQAGADQLDDDEAVKAVCEILVGHGYQHPFYGLDNHVSQGEWLDFVKAATHRSLQLVMSGDYLLLAEQWPKERGRATPTTPIPSPMMVMGIVLRNHGIGHHGIRSVNLAYNKLRKLITEGEEMLQSFEYSTASLSQETITNWGQRLISVAETCASIRELKQLKDDYHNRHIGVGEMLPYELGKPPETYPRVEELFSKVKIARAIAKRLEDEDQG